MGAHVQDPQVGMSSVLADFHGHWILFEDADFIVVDKPAGVPSQAADGSADDDVRARLARYLARRDSVELDDVYLGVHQRLDKETSGVLLFTKNTAANPTIAKQFECRSIGKRYLAGVTGFRGGERTLRDVLAKGRGGKMVVLQARERGRGKLAVTHVKQRSRNGTRCLLELGCETGRTHQLRVQLAHAGYPISGDGLYGGVGGPRMLLHAEWLRFESCSGEMVEINAPVPAAFGHWFEYGTNNELDERSLLAALPVALQRRYGMFRFAETSGRTSCFRLAHREADGLAGVALDVYGRHLVVNLFDEAFAVEDAVLARVSKLGFEGVYVKRHPRQKNTLVDARGDDLCPAAPVMGEPAPEPLIVHEYGVPFAVSLGDGLRTGLFLDQRENRRRVAELAGGKRVLNLFAYTGGFSTAALAAGASAALCVDASAIALERARDNVQRIGATERHRTWTGDVFEVLPRLVRRNEQFDIIVLDPPSYATTKRRRFRAAKDYPELVALCLQVLAPGGFLLSCLNHHQVTQGRLRALVSAGAETAAVQFRSHRDVEMGRDFVPVPGREPLFKSVLSQRL